MANRRKSGSGEPRSQALTFPPCAQRGEVAPSYGDGGVIGRTGAGTVSPSAPAGHLPALRAGRKLKEVERSQS